MSTQPQPSNPTQLNVIQQVVSDRYRVICAIRARPTCEVPDLVSVLATDTVDSQEVVIRLIAADCLTEDGLYRFENHLRATNRISNPSFLRPLDWSVEGEFVYCVHQHLRAISLAQHVRRARSNNAIVVQNPSAEFLRFSRSLLEILSQIHEVDCVRQDFRLSQILLHESRPHLVCAGPELFINPQRRGEAWSLDFASFASPELSGLIEHDINASSDLYSVGILMYRLLTGKQPFAAKKLGEILFQHLTAKPDLSRLNHVPDPLVQIVNRLLNKEPRDRYQSASAVIHDLHQLAVIQQGKLQPEQFVLGQNDPRDSITDPAFIGRFKELSTLKRGIEGVQQGDYQNIVIQAESGIGKSQLVVESLRHANSLGFTVFKCSRASQAANEPAAALESIVQQVILRTELYPRLKEALREYQPEVVQALPKLAKAFGWRKSGSPSLLEDAQMDSFNVNRINQAYCRVLASLATPNAPVLIWIDDCQWLDPQTIDVLYEFQKVAPSNTLLILSLRDSDPSTGSVLSTIRATHTIGLKRLTDFELRAMLESMAGHLPLQAVEAIVNLSEGSPFMATAIVRGMAETGAIVFEENGWTINPDRMSDIQASADSADALLKRLETVSVEAMDLISSAAVIGKEFNARTVARISGCSTQVVNQHLAACRRQRLVWKKPSGNFAFVHDRVRETLVDRLPGKRRKQIHLKIAEHLIAGSDTDPREVAIHYDAAGQHAKALPFALRAVKSAKQAYSLGAAIQSLRVAVRGIEIKDKSTFRATALDLAEALMLNGEYDEADLWFQKASLIETSVNGLARIDMQRGELAFRQGDKEQAVILLERALEKLGRTLPKSRIPFACQLIWEIAVQGAHTLLPRCFVGSKNTPPSPIERMTWRIYSRLAHSYWYTQGTAAVYLAHLRGLNHAERYPPSRELAQAWSEHAPGLSLIPIRGRGERYSLHSLRVREELGDVWGQGQSRGFYSVFLYATSQQDKCIEQARKAESILLRTGDYWEVNIARYQLAAALYRRGHLKEAVEVAKRTYGGALKIGDHQSTVNIVDVWARANQGVVPEEILNQEKRRLLKDQQARSQILLAEGVTRIRQRRYAEAVNCFEKAIRTAERSTVINAYTSPNYTWLCTALRLQHEAKQASIPDKRKYVSSNIVRAARRALRMGGRFRNDLPHAWREWGYVLHMKGRSRRARKAFEKSIRIADEQRAEYESALSQFAYGTIGQELGWPDAITARLEAQARLNDLEGSPQIHNTTQDSMSVVDRFDALLDAGRQITSSLEEDVVLSHTVKAAKHLLRGDRTLIVEKSDDVATWTVHGNSDATLSTAELNMICRAATQNHTTTNGHNLHNDRGQAIAMSTQGSILVSPIPAKGKLARCLFVSNSLVSGIYGKDEVRIADYLTCAAGSAVDKASVFQQLENLNQSLEQKVHERTRIIEARSRELELTAKTLRTTQTKLETARDEAEAANVAKSEFLARMSHEIRTPISAVLGFTKLMLRGVVKSADFPTTLRTIESSGQHLLQLVNDLLDLSKVEANKLEVELTEIIPARLIHEAVTSLQARAIENNNELTMKFEGQIPITITSDQKRFQQILTNVIGNAIKFTDHGVITVLVRLIGTEAAKSQGNQVPGERAQLEVQITDTGIGMTESQVANIFDPFVQADSSITRRFGGTGLGLSISRQLAESLGGGISVSSTPAIGSVFTIRVDTGAFESSTLISSNEAWKLIEEQPHADQLTVCLDGLKVFIADDAETNRDLLSLILQDSGASVELAENGREAVERLLVNPGFDVVLMDMQMPILDGYSASRQLRDAGFGVPIVALTANSMMGDREKCIEAGCSDYLSKPINLSALLSKLADIAHIETPVQQVDDQARGTRSCQKPQVDPAFDSELTHQLPTTEPFRSFAGKFLDKLKSKRNEFIASIADRDQENVATLAHWAAGTSGTVGLEYLSYHFRKMECAAKWEKWDDVDDALHTLQEFLGNSNEVVA